MGWLKTLNGTGPLLMLLAALVLFLLWQQMFICTSGSVSLPLCQNWWGCKHYISIAVIFLLCFYNETLSWQVGLSVDNSDQSRCVHLVDCFSLLNDFASSSLLLWLPMSSTFLLKHVYLPYVFVCGCFFLAFYVFKTNLLKSLSRVLWKHWAMQLLC